MGISTGAPHQPRYNAPRPSDSLDLNAWLAQLDPGVGARLRAGTYETDETIVIPGGRHLVGQAPGVTAATTIRQATGASIQGAILTTEAWNSNAGTSGVPTYVAHLRVDGNRAACPGSTASGILIMNYWSTVEHCYVTRAPEDGITFRDTNRNGDIIANSASENRVQFCKVHDVGRDAYFFQCQNNISNQDGYAIHNLGSDCRDFMRFERISGWHVERNHGYTIRRNGITGQNAFATVVAFNEIENYGTENTPGAFYGGISVTQLNGRSTHVVNNFVGQTEPAGTATFQALVCTAGVGQATARITCIGNELVGAGTPRGRGLVGQVQAGGLLGLNEGLNQISSMNTPTFFGAGVSLTGVIRTA